MKTATISIVVMLSLALGGLVQAHPAPPASSVELAPVPAVHGWIARESDNICGITTLKRVTNPAKVNYGVLFDATPQVREMKRKRLDPDSPEGQALRKGARTLITKACQLVRQARSHCSVWRIIRHKDGRSIPDVTTHVLERF